MNAGFSQVRISLFSPAGRDRRPFFRAGGGDAREILLPFDGVWYIVEIIRIRVPSGPAEGVIPWGRNVKNVPATGMRDAV